MKACAAVINSSEIKIQNSVRPAVRRFFRKVGVPNTNIKYLLMKKSIRLNLRKPVVLMNDCVIG